MGPGGDTRGRGWLWSPVSSPLAVTKTHESRRMLGGSEPSAVRCATHTAHSTTYTVHNALRTTHRTVPRGCGMLSSAGRGSGASRSPGAAGPSFGHRRVLSANNCPSPALALLQLHPPLPHTPPSRSRAGSPSEPFTPPVGSHCPSSLGVFGNGGGSPRSPLSRGGSAPTGVLGPPQTPLPSTGLCWDQHRGKMQGRKGVGCQGRSVNILMIKRKKKRESRKSTQQS